MKINKQHTLKEGFSLSGKGFSSEHVIHVSFYPAPENYGYRIKRVDLKEEPVIHAIIENVAENGINFCRSITLSCNDIQIRMIEHAIAALYALQVDNCLIEINSSEFPILNGSAIAYVHEIERVGLQEQLAEREYYIVKNKMEIYDEIGKSSVVLLPDDRLVINALISFNSKVINNQFAILDRIEDFKKEIATCRTFIFNREIDLLLKNHLIRKGELDDLIVIYERPILQDRLNYLTDRNSVVKDISQLEYTVNRPLLYPNELARHELLDILGEIALFGKPIHGRLIATCSENKMSHKLIRLIRKNMKLNLIQAPEYNPDKPSLMNIKRIRELLPHRYPFLLVDKVIDIGENHIVGIKNVSVNEPFFQGHFPEEPVMPGVLLVEAMAQVGGLLVLNTLLDDPILYSTYFIKMDAVKFRQKVVPGDTLIFHLKLLSELRRGIANMKGNCFVGEKLVCEAELMAQIVKNKS